MSPLAAQMPALQVVVPMLMAPFVLLLPRGLAWAAAAAASLMALGIAAQLTATVIDSGPVAYQMGSWPAPYGIELGIDALSALLLLVVTGASSLALLGGRASLVAAVSEDREHYFYAAWLLALAGTCRNRRVRRCVQYLRVHGNFLAGKLRARCRRPRPPRAACGFQVLGYGHGRRHLLSGRHRADLHDDRHAEPRRHGVAHRRGRGQDAHSRGRRIHHRGLGPESRDFPAACLAA